MRARFRLLAVDLSSPQHSESCFAAPHNPEAADPSCLPVVDADGTYHLCCRSLGAELRKRRSIAHAQGYTSLFSVRSLERPSHAAFLKADNHVLADNLWSENETGQLLFSTRGSLDKARRAPEMTNKGTLTFSGQIGDRDRGSLHARNRIKSLSVPMSERRYYRWVKICRKNFSIEVFIFKQMCM